MSRASHDGYGKGLLEAILQNRWGNWFEEAQRSIDMKGATAKIDAIIRTTDLSRVECAVEIEATNCKQLRGAIFDLAFHTAPKKLLVVIRGQNELQKMSDEQIRSHCLYVWNKLDQSSPFAFAVLEGSGSNPTPELDTARLREALAELKVL